MAEPLRPDEILSETRALCPVCLRRLPALRVRRDGEVWLTRLCPEHGPAEAVIWRGGPDFASWRRPKTPSAPSAPQTPARRGCPFDCGLCPEHGQRTCTAVVEVTARCNLSCPVCYASATRESSPDPTTGPDPGATTLAALLERLRRDAGPCNLQLSGGEPTVRHDLPEIIAAAARLGFGLVQLNTNGLRLAKEPGYAEALARAGLQSVFLQFDGPDEACLALRGRPLHAEKTRAVEACAKAGLGVVLVPTLVRGVNERHLGGILRFGVAHFPAVRGVHFQPAASFGRFLPAMSESDRLTLPEVLALLVEQSRGLLSATDFHPPGCEHERCSFSARYAVEDGRLSLLPDGACCDGACGVPAPPSPPVPTAEEGARKAIASVARQWAAPAMSPEPTAAAAPPRDDFERFLASRGAHTRFSISCMAFQDAATLDLERVRGCCIHTLAPDGRRIPFCLYNLTSASGAALYRSAP